jgi:hypothetical protein
MQWQRQDQAALIPEGVRHQEINANRWVSGTRVNDLTG